MFSFRSARKCVGLSNQLMLIRSMSEGTSFSTNNFNGFVKSPTVPEAITVVVHGQPDVPKANETQEDLDNLKQGTLKALEMISTTLNSESNPVPELEDFIAPDCKENLRALGSVSAPKILVQDVFFTWFISRELSSNGGKINLGVLSFPNQTKFKADLEAHKHITEPTPENVERINQDRLELLNSDFLVTNIAMEDNGSGWLMRNLSIKPGREAYSRYFHIKVKGRLALAWKAGGSYLFALRYDYGTDLVLVTMLMVLILIPSKHM